MELMELAVSFQLALSLIESSAHENSTFKKIFKQYMFLAVPSQFCILTAVVY